MASVNQVNLIGNLARDPELKYTPQGKAVCEFALGVDGGGKESPSMFFNIEVWEKQAEACAKHLQKGSLVHIEGRLHQDRWEKDGKQMSKVKVVGNRVTFLGNIKKADKKGSAPPSEAGAPVEGEATQEVAEEVTT